MCFCKLMCVPADLFWVWCSVVLVCGCEQVDIIHFFFSSIFNQSTSGESEHQHQSNLSNLVCLLLSWLLLLLETGIMAEEEEVEEVEVVEGVQ